MPTEIYRGEVQRLGEEGALVLDVLSLDDYRKSHLPGAINLPLANLDGETSAHLDRRSPLVVYCYDYQ